MWRVTCWVALAMGVTAAVDALFGTRRDIDDRAEKPAPVANTDVCPPRPEVLRMTHGSPVPPRQSPGHARAATAPRKKGAHTSQNRVTQYLRSLGPGLTTGAADDDPSGIGTYSQQGAQSGFQLLWLAPFIFPLIAIVQEMCARIGIVSGQGLAANISKHYPKGVLYAVCLLLFVANTLNIAADLGAMSASLRLLAPRVNPSVGVVGFALFCITLQIFSSYAKYSKLLKYLTCVLLSYVLTAFTVKVDWREVVRHTFVPSLTWSREEILLLCAVFGTTISPYLFFWQTSQEVEEHRLAQGVDHMRRTHRSGRHDGDDMRTEIRKMRVDVWSGMFVGNLVMFFVVLTCAATLHANGITRIATAEQAARAIRPLSGALASWLFAIGIIGTGLLAVPVLAGASAYAIAESARWRTGLHYHLARARAFYGVMMVSMVIAVSANIAGLDPIRGLIYSAMANGIIAPVMLFFVVRISSRMTKFGNHWFITWCGWLVTAIMTMVGIAAVAALLA